MRHSIPLFILMIALSGCAQFRTGETRLYAMTQDQDGVLPIGSWSICDVASYAIGTQRRFSGYGEAIEEGEPFSIVINTAHLRYFDAASGEILVYAEFTDLEGKEVFANRVFHAEDICQGSRLNFDNLLVLPSFVFDGRPIKFRLTIVELDKEDSEQAKKLVEVAATIGSAAAPQYAILINLAAQAINALIAQNEDDIELQHTVVFHPHRDRSYHFGSPEPVLNSSHTPLVTGKFLLVKDEHRDRNVWPSDYTDYIWKPIPYLLWHVFTLNFIHKRYAIRGITDAVRRESTRAEPFEEQLQYLCFSGNELQRRDPSVTGIDVASLVLPVPVGDTYGTLLSRLGKRRYTDKSYVVLEVTRPAYRMEPTILQTLGVAERKKLDELLISKSNFTETATKVSELLNSYTQARALLDSARARRSTAPNDPACLIPLISALSTAGALTSEDYAAMDALDRFLVVPLPRTTATRDALKNTKNNLARVLEVDPSTGKFRFKTPGSPPW